MQYTITGSNGYRMRSDQVRRLCGAIGVSLLDLLVEAENDRHPLHFISVYSHTFLTTARVREVFGETFELLEDL